MPGITRDLDPITCGDVAKSLFTSVKGNNLNTVRKSDPTYGSSPHSPTTYSLASPNVFAGDVSGSGNLNFGVVRVGDPIIPHGHPGTVASGSNNVFVNSGGGAGSIIDNNPAFINVGQINENLIDTALPPNMKSPLDMPVSFINANPNITAAEIKFYETDDEQTMQPVPPSGTVVREDRTSIDHDPTPAVTNPPPVHTCNDVSVLPTNFTWDPSGFAPPSAFDTWAQSFQLSPNFTVYDLTVGPAVSTYRFNANPIQPIGLTQKEILTNMCYLANVILQPLKNQYGAFTITSAWRNATNGSQHNKGEAADIQFTTFHNLSTTGQQYFARAQAIRDAYNFDQMILEWFGKNPWIHISVNPGNHRHQVLTQISTNSYTAGLTLLG